MARHPGIFFPFPERSDIKSSHFLHINLVKTEGFRPLLKLPSSMTKLLFSFSVSLTMSENEISEKIVTVLGGNTPEVALSDRFTGD